MKKTGAVKKKTPTEAEAHEGRRILLGPIARALTTIMLIAIAGVVLVLVLGRPKSVAFLVSFKCERFSPGSALDLSFENCDKLKFRAHLFQIPRESYDPTKNDNTKTGPLKVAIKGGELVTAEFGGDYTREAFVRLNRDGVIELHSSKEATELGEVRVSSADHLSMYAWSLTFTTPTDGEFTGFQDGVSDSLIGTITIDESEDSQGSGGPPLVGASVAKVLGPVSIHGTKDEIAGWSPISLKEGPSRKPFDLENGSLWAEKVSSCALSINRKPVDMGTAINRFQVDVVKARLTKLAIYQGASDGYIEVALSGVCESIKQNNTEVIEPVISRLLSQPSYRNGLAGLSLVIVIFVAGIFLKRALGVLAETWLPKSKDDSDT